MSDNPLHYRTTGHTAFCGNIRLDGQRLRLTPDPLQVTCARCKHKLQARHRARTPRGQRGLDSYR